MFGGFIMNLPPKDSPTPIENIDKVLESQENSLTAMHEESGYALVNTSAIQQLDQ